MTLFILGTRRRGRPPQLDRRAVRVEFVVTASERADLQHVANETGQPLSRIIREAINSYVGDYTDRAVLSSRIKFR